MSAQSRQAQSKVLYGQHLVHLTCQGEYKKIANCIRSAPQLAREFLIAENDPQRSPVFIAAKRHFLKCLSILIEQGRANPSIKTEDGITPLHLAANNDNEDMPFEEADTESAVGDESCTTDFESPSLKVIEYLISCNVDVLAKDITGCIPLHYACRYGAIKVAKILLQHKEWNQIEVRDREGLTPIMYAVRSGQLNVVRYLLDQGAAVQGLDEHKSNIFHHACQSANVKVLDVLEDYYKEKEMRADQLMKGWNIDGEIPLHCASASGELQMVKRCLQITGYDSRFRTPKGENLLHIVALCRNFVGIDDSFVRELANEPDLQERTPLFNAIECSDIESIQFLLDHGAITNHKDRHHVNPLLRAAKLGRAEVCELLMKHPDLVLDIDDQSRNALMLAAEWKHLEVVKAILNDPVGLKLVNREDANGNTALHIAVRSGSRNIVTALLEQKADPFIQNSREYTPLHVAAIHGRKEIATLLYKQFENLANETDENGNYPIHLAAEFGHAPILKLFVSDTAQKNARNIQGRTPLARAAEHKRTECVQLLVKESAAVDAEDRSRMTPLMLACKMGNSEIVSILLENYADPSKRVDTLHPHYSGWNSLDFAVDAKSIECVKLILGTSKWRQVLTNPTVDIKQKVYTPFRRMIRNLPSAAKLVLDRCVFETRVGDSLETRFDYEFIEENNLYFPPDGHFQWESGEVQGAAMMAKHIRSTVDYIPGLRSNVNIDVDNAENVDLLELGTKKHTTKKTRSWCNCSDKLGKRCKSFRRIVRGICCSCCEKVDADKEGGSDASDDDDDDDDYRTVYVNRPPHVLNFMIKHDREELLNHELTCSLLTYKWVRTAIVFYINLFIYMLFLALFTSYMLMTQAPFEVLQGNITNLTDSCASMEKAGVVAHKLFISVPKYGVLVLAGVRLIMEAIELVVRRLDYVDFVNTIEVSMYSLALLTVIDYDPCMRVTGLRNNWQWQTGSVGILLAWFDFLFFVRRGPYFGIYVIMFATVFRTFVKFFVVFCPFILGFVFAFHALLNNKTGFMNVKNALIKTLGMTTGELDTSDMLFAGKTSTDYGDVVFYEDITFTVFGCSVALVTIAMMNLLIGLAVDDIKEVQRHATLESLRMKIKIVFETEANTKKCCKLLTVPPTYTYKRGRPETLFDRFFQYQFEESRKVIRDVVSEEDNAAEEEKESKENVQIQVQKIKVQTLQIARLLDKLASRPAPT